MSVNALWQLSAGTATSLTAGAAHFQADLETAAGGSGTIPNPHDLLDAALASCTTLTLQLYTKRKQIPLEAVSVDVSHQEAGGVYRIKRVLHFTGNLSEAQTADLLRVANVCPIHKALHGQFEVATEVATEATIAPAA